MFVFPNSKPKMTPKASSSVPFLTPLKATPSVSNKAAGRNRLWPSGWCEFENRQDVARRHHLLPRRTLGAIFLQEAGLNFFLVWPVAILKPHLASHNHLVFRLFLSSSPCLLPSSLFFPTPPPRVLLREFSLCASSFRRGSSLLRFVSRGLGEEAVSSCILASGFVAGDTGCSGCQQTGFKKSFSLMTRYTLKENLIIQLEKQRKWNNVLI